MYGHQGMSGASRAIRASWGIGVPAGHWGGMGCRGSEASRGLGCMGIKQCQGASRDVGASGGIRGMTGVEGVSGHWGCRGVWGIGGGRWTGNPTTMGPCPGSQHSHWFPLGSDLPHHGQVRTPFQGPVTPSGFPWRVTYLTKARQVTKGALQAIIYI